jgi:hypothetical protein
LHRRGLTWQAAGKVYPRCHPTGQAVHQPRVEGRSHPVT